MHHYWATLKSLGEVLFHASSLHATADLMISSALMSEAYEQKLPDYEAYRERLALPA